MNVPSNNIQPEWQWLLKHKLDDEPPPVVKLHFRFQMIKTDSVKAERASVALAQACCR
jgi:hypothetical protein